MEGREDTAKGGKEGKRKATGGKNTFFFFFKTTICFINLMRKLKYHQYRMKPLSRKNNFQ